MMGEFFNPWRRKIGVLTLLVALVLLGGWVRSLLVWDEFLIPMGTRIKIGVISTDQQIGCGIKLFSKAHQASRFPSWHPFARNTLEHVFDNDTGYLLKRWQCFAIIRSEGQNLNVYFVAYWFIVIPLTLLSAYLLLVKPRPKTIPAKST